MIKMVITDLDGTLLRSDRTVSAEDYKTLTDLKENGVVRVIATGRSPFSFSRVIRDDFPVDYLVFSSGVGVMNFQTREILTTHSLPAEKVRELAALFQSKEISFKVLAPVPDNHHYHYYETGHSHPDFYRRMEYYRGFETPISFSPPNFGKASQFLIIMPPDVALFESLKAECKGVKVIRATSPIDHESIWMEVFHPDVSKAEGVKFICDLLHIHPEETLGVGNDYNDLDLLGFTGTSFVVSNAPEELRKRYPVVKTNDRNGFTDAVQRVWRQRV